MVGSTIFAPMPNDTSTQMMATNHEYHLLGRSSQTGLYGR